MASETNEIVFDNITADVNNFKILQKGLSIAKKLELFFLNANPSAERNRKFKM